MCVNVQGIREGVEGQRRGKRKRERGERGGGVIYTYICKCEV